MKYVSLSWYHIPELVVPDRWFLLTKKLLNQGLLVVMMKSLLQKFYGRHNELVKHSTVSKIFMIYLQMSQATQFWTFLKKLIDIQKYN